MRLRYGNYWHGFGECEVSIARSTVFSNLGVPYEVEHTWSVRGQLLGDTTAQVVAAFRLLEIAYSRPFLSAVLVDANGLVCHALPNPGSTSGVRVSRPPGYPTGSGAELTTFRNYELALSATYPMAAGRQPVYRSFRETLRAWGGLPDRRMTTTLTGAPVPYVSARRTPYRAVQAGSAVGFSFYPPIPAPIFGFGLLDGPDHPSGSDGPTVQDGRLTDYAVNWSYSFVSATPLVGRPTVVVG